MIADYVMYSLGSYHFRKY